RRGSSRQCFRRRPRQTRTYRAALSKLVHSIGKGSREVVTKAVIERGLEDDPFDDGPGSEAGSRRQWTQLRNLASGYGNDKPPSSFDLTQDRPAIVAEFPHWDPDFSRA